MGQRVFAEFMINPIGPPENSNVPEDWVYIHFRCGRGGYCLLRRTEHAYLEAVSLGDYKWKGSTSRIKRFACRRAS